MTEATGKELRKGQLVHVNLSGMFAAIVVDVVLNPIVTPGQQPVPPHVILQVILKEGSPNGQVVPNLYLVRDVEGVKEMPSASGLVQ